MALVHGALGPDPVAIESDVVLEGELGARYRHPAYLFFVMTRAPFPIFSPSLLQEIQVRFVLPPRMQIAEMPPIYMPNAVRILSGK